MKLYYAKGACSLACRIIINELNLSSEFESVDLVGKKTQSGKDFYSINPKGSVPVLRTSDNKILTENAVILQYLSDTNKAEQLLPFVGSFERYKVLEWLNYVATELHKSFAPLFKPNVTQEMKDKVILPLIKEKLAIANRQLEKNQYLCGDHFTLPDAYLFVMLTWALLFKIKLEEFPALSQYFSNLQSRKSIAQSLEDEGLHLKKA